MPCKNLPPTPPPLALPATAIITPGRKHGELLARNFSPANAHSARLVLGSIDLFIFPQLVVASSFVGSSAAQLLVDTLRLGGVTQLTFLGIAAGICSGSVCPNIGDFVIPDLWQPPLDSSPLGAPTATSDLVRPTISFTQQMISELSEIAAVHVGSAISVSTLSIQTPEFVSSSGQRGILAVDMESSFVALACAAADISYRAAFVISDLLGTHWTPGFSSKKLRRSWSTLCRAAVALA